MHFYHLISQFVRPLSCFALGQPRSNTSHHSSTPSEMAVVRQAKAKPCIWVESLMVGDAQQHLRTLVSRIYTQIQLAALCTMRKRAMQKSWQNLGQSSYRISTQREGRRPTAKPRAGETVQSLRTPSIFDCKVSGCLPPCSTEHPKVTRCKLSMQIILFTRVAGQPKCRPLSLPESPTYQRLDGNWSAQWNPCYSILTAAASEI